MDCGGRSRTVTRSRARAPGMTAGQRRWAPWASPVNHSVTRSASSGRRNLSFSARTARAGPRVRDDRPRVVLDATWGHLARRCGRAAPDAVGPLPVRLGHLHTASLNLCRPGHIRTSSAGGPQSALAGVPSPRRIDRPESEGASAPGSSFTGADAELGEDLAQVVLDGARTDEQLRADLRVRVPVARHAGDLRLLGREDVARLRSAPGHGLAGGRELAAGALGERFSAHRGEHLVRRAQLLARVDPAVFAAQPLPVSGSSCRTKPCSMRLISGIASGNPNPPATAVRVSPRGNSNSASGLPDASARIRSRTRSSSGPGTVASSSTRASSAPMPSTASSGGPPNS